jgi:predicted nucleotidyltransferase/HEPN domain-containing protein
MKTSFPEKSKDFEETIRSIAAKIIEISQDKIAFIILFGSFAKGSWVFDRYSEDNTVYTYASDYDFLVVTKERNVKKNGISDSDLEKKIGEIAYSKYGHNPHFVIEPIDYVNSELEKGRYFFSDIKKEGIMLYDSGEFKLADAKVLSEDEVREIAWEDYEHWFAGGLSFLDTTYDRMKKDDFVKAAFQLHQATESFYNCTLLTLTGYKPKTHDLIELNKLCCAQSNDFLSIFPQATKDQQESFKLLNKSYIDARYNKHFTITKEQLEYLTKRVERLNSIVEKVCREKI